MNLRSLLSLLRFYGEEKLSLLWLYQVAATTLLRCSQTFGLPCTIRELTSLGFLGDVILSVGLLLWVKCICVFVCTQRAVEIWWYTHNVFYLSRLCIHCVPNFSLCCQPLWRFVDDVEDERLLVYRSEDIKDFSRLQSPKVCGYLKLSEDELLPKGLEDREQNEGECPYLGRAASLKQISSFNSFFQFIVGMEGGSSTAHAC